MQIETNIGMNNKDRFNGKALHRTKASGDWQDDDVLFRLKDPALSAQIKRQMRARLDLEEVTRDPELEKTRKDVGKMIGELRETGKDQDSGKSKFIREALAGKKERSEKNVLKYEAWKGDINDLSAEWVKEWHRKKQMEVAASPADEERKSFISGSMENAGPVPAEQAEVKTGSNKRRLFIRYTSVAAAAVIGIIFLIKSLSPVSYSSLFSAYYKPFDAFSGMTRGGDDINASAINYYKSGEYAIAAAAFTEVLNEKPESVTTTFYLGLTDLALGDISNSINRLEAVVQDGGEYMKVAEWYLGLACLKTDKKDKAIECFRDLSRTKGYYSSRSKKILRRLK